MAGPGRERPVDPGDPAVAQRVDETAGCILEQILEIARVLQGSARRFAVRHVSRQRKARIAAIVSSGALRFGQWPVARMSTISLPGMLRCTYSPTHCGAITSSEHCRISERTARPRRSARLSDRKVVRAKRRAISGSVRQKLLASSS